MTFLACSLSLLSLASFCDFYASCLISGSVLIESPSRGDISPGFIFGFAFSGEILFDLTYFRCHLVWSHIFQVLLDFAYFRHWCLVSPISGVIRFLSISDIISFDFTHFRCYLVLPISGIDIWFHLFQVSFDFCLFQASFDFRLFRRCFIWFRLSRRCFVWFHPF